MQQIILSSAGVLAGSGLIYKDRKVPGSLLLCAGLLGQMVWFLRSDVVHIKDLNITELKVAQNVTALRLQNLPNVKELPLLSKLRSLEVIDCPNLVRFNLPKKMDKIHIFRSSVEHLHFLKKMEKLGVLGLDGCHQLGAEAAHALKESSGRVKQVVVHHCPLLKEHLLSIKELPVTLLIRNE